MEGCHALRVEGHTYRYFLAGSSSGTTDALLVDLGGPGLSLSGVLPQDWSSQLRKDLAPLEAGKSLLLIEEPWVTSATDETCRTSLASYYSWVRVHWREPTPAAAPVVTCHWQSGELGWSSSRYREVVQAIVAELGVRRLHMVGLSFGAVRYSYVDDLVASAVLVRPAAAPGTLNEKVLDARTAALWRGLADECRSCGHDLTVHATQVIDHYARSAVEVPDRSLPMTDFDVASALVAAPMDATKGQGLGWELSSATINVRRAAALSDALWLRSGTTGLSPAFAAYVDEYCRAYPGAPGPPTADPVRLVLDAASSCHGLPRGPDRAAARPVRCVITGQGDTSAPPELASTWAVSPGGSRVTSQVAKHWFTNLEGCGHE